jgi:hypothetical protein
MVRFFSSSLVTFASIAFASGARDDYNNNNNNLRQNQELLEAREECNFKCPPDMWCKANRDCYNNLDDCLDREPDQCNFQCPQDTICKRQVICFDSIADCRGENEPEDRDSSNGPI